MLEFTRLPFELLYSIFHELEVPDLLSFARVSRYYKILSADNGVWSQKALKHWENKEGMRGLRKKQRDANDLVENTWHYAWSIAGDGSICLNQNTFRSYRCPNWNLIISKDYLVFKSSSAESFKRKLKKFKLIDPVNDNLISDNI
ncbi:2959_t:CDS:2 [Dentiscutata erythropus]|uniref:2959_t:CDS:1 n=1 Tax=Dentiscutata erythropus TaxID=1348616 RepID=A0A9N8ZAU4_9GLOM|nr:2959_t:CDS:2 [Dentiscutata erythropus]